MPLCENGKVERYYPLFDVTSRTGTSDKGIFSFMKFTVSQLEQFERILEEKGYRKYVCKKDPGRRVHDYSSVCVNESWHWYKSVEKVREEDEDGDLRTKYNVLLYIAFWNYTKYPETVQQGLWVAGTQVVVKVCDEAYCNTFEFPFYHDKEENNLFFDYDPEAEGEWYTERKVTDEELERLISNLEILAIECSAFYRKEVQWIVNSNLRNDNRTTKRN